MFNPVMLINQRCWTASILSANAHQVKPISEYNFVRMIAFTMPTGHYLGCRITNELS